MERIIHSCGQPLARHESGGVARTVHYAMWPPTSQELYMCPACGADLADADMYRVEILEDIVVAIAIAGLARFVFPFQWSGARRAYSYVTLGAPAARREYFDGTWHTESVDLVTFQRWMLALEEAA